MPIRLSNAARVAMIAAGTALVDGGSGAGKLRIYTGAQPAGPDTTTAETLLAEFTLADPSFAAGATGVQDLDADPDLSTTGLADGNAGWCRYVDSNAAAGAAGVVDGSVATSGADLNLNTVAISTGVTVIVTSGSITLPAGP